MLQLAAQVLDQVLVQARRRRPSFEQRVEVRVQRLALFRREVARQVAFPVEADPGLDEVGVVMVRAAEHQVGLQALVEEIAAAAGAQLFLDAGHQARGEHRDQQLAVDAGGLLAEHVALVQPVAFGPARRVAGEILHRVELWQYGQDVALGRAQRLDAARQRVDALVDRGDVALVGAVAGDPYRRHRQHHQRGGAQRADGQPLAAALDLRVGADQAAFAERHFAEQPLDEVAAPGSGLPRQVLAVEVHRLRHAADQAVDRTAFLGSAGEVQAAQQRAFLVGVGLEHAVEELAEAFAQGGELLREAVDQVAPRRVALLLQAFHQARGETLFEQGEFAVEHRQRAFRALAVVEGEGHPPDLRAFLAVQAVEELHEARHQVELGQHHVDREAHPELLVQLLDACADRLGMGGALGVAAQQQVGKADGDERAIDGAALALGLEQVEEAQPGGLVHLGVAVLGGIAAGGVQQHRFVGEPPVAVARAADPADRPGAHLRGEREVQAGIHQRGGLARTGRADDHVPGQLVQVAPLAAAQLGPLEQGQGLVHALLERRQLFGGGDAGGVRRADLGETLHDLRRVAPGLHDAQHAEADPDQEQQNDQHPAAGRRGQRFVVAQAQQRAEEPDDQAQGEQAEHRHHPAREEVEEAFHCAPSANTVISTRRLRARPSALALVATGSVSLRPSAVKRPASPVVAPSRSATSWARAWDSFQLDG